MRKIATTKSASESPVNEANPGVSRIERRKSEFRDRITLTAMRLFDENGVADTSIATIIKEADIAHKTFFNHFPTKDHLLQHIVSSHSETAYTRFRDTFDKYSDPKKRLEYCLMSIANALGALNPRSYKDLLTFYIVSSASTRDFRENQKRNFTELITQILQHAHEQKRLKTRFSIEVTSEMVVGICVSTLLNWCVEEDYLIVKKMKSAVEFINDAIFVEDAT